MSCGSCKGAISWFLYKKDTLNGEKLLIPKNEEWELCSKCGIVLGKKILGGK